MDTSTDPRPARPTPPREPPPAVGVDAEILALYAARRWDEACALLHQIYWQPILAIATRRMRGWTGQGAVAEAAEDVAMEALHRIHQSLRRKTEDGTIGEIVLLRAWVRRLVERQAFDVLTRRVRQPDRPDAEGAVEDRPDEGALTEAAVVELLDADRRLTDLRRCVADVEQRLGQALRLWLGGRTYLAVARELGYASLSAAQSAVQGGIQKVARCMSAKGWAPAAAVPGGRR